jgi:DNA-binding transcriptional ArsR family regulator
MRFLVLGTFLSCIGSNLCAGADLKHEAIALLKASIEQSEGVPESMTPDKLYQVIAGEVDFEVSEADSALLDERKSPRDSKELNQVVANANALKAQRLPISVEQIIKALEDPSTDARTREAAFRLLSHFNRMKLKSLTTLNISRAKQLCVAIVGGAQVKAISDIEGYMELRFKNLADEQDWLYSSTGFGDLGDAAPHGGKVILMAPSTIDGNLVMGCDNGSVYALPLDKVRERIDVSKLKPAKAEQAVPPNGP